MQGVFTPTIEDFKVRQDRDARLPSLQRALLLTLPPRPGDEEQNPKDRAKQLVNAMAVIAGEWFDSSRWYYKEDVTCVSNDAGAQWGYYSEPEARYITSPTPRHSQQVRIVLNIYQAVIEQGQGILTNEEPIFAASATKSDVQDSAGQEATDQFIEWAWREHDLSSLYIDSGRDIFNTGNAVVHVVWDKHAGPSVPAGIGPDGAPQPARSTGDWQFQYLPRESYCPDPSARNPRLGAGVFLREEITVDQLMVDHPEKWEEVRQDLSGDNSDSKLDLNRAEQSARMSPLDSGGVLLDDDQAKVTRYTFYGRKTLSHPRGIHLVFTEDTLLHVGENPKYPKDGEPDTLFSNRPWPVFHIIGKSRNMTAWGAGRGPQLIPVQRAINGSISKTLQHIAMISNAKIKIPTNMMVDWTDEIGQQIPVSRNMNPNAIGYIQPPNLPPEYLATVEHLIDKMYTIGGTSASTMGQSAPNIESGRQAEMMIGRDYGRLGKMKTRLDSAWCEIMRYAMQLFQRHAETPRKVLIAGDNNSTSVRYFDKTSFATSIDLRVMNDQSIPRDPAKRSIWMTHFLQNYSLAQDPEAKRLVLTMYRVRDFAHLISKLDPDEVKAHRMVAKLMLGEPSMILDADDPLVFKMVLEALMKSEEWESRVAEETQAAGMSATEQATMAYWTFYANKAAAAVAPAQMGPATASQPQSGGAPATEQPAGMAA